MTPLDDLIGAAIVLALVYGSAGLFLYLVHLLVSGEQFSLRDMAREIVFWVRTWRLL
jgi:hypothetical protein